MQDSTRKVLKIILAVVLPPAAAYWQVKLSIHFWINLILWLILWIPAIVHALWLVLTDKKA